MKQSRILSRMFTGGLIAAVGLLAAGTLCAADTTTGTSGKTADFLKEAAQGNQAEVALAEIAEQKAQNAEVKQFAQHLRKDHQQALQKVQALAQAHGVKLDNELGFFQRRQQDKFQKMSAGAEFDKEFSRLMLEEHVKEINKYDKALEKIQEADVKEYAQTTVQKLREHLNHAQTAARAAGVDEKTITSITKKTSDATGGTADKSEGEAGTSKKQE